MGENRKRFAIRTGVLTSLLALSLTGCGSVWPSGKGGEVQAAEVTPNVRPAPSAAVAQAPEPDGGDAANTDGSAAGETVSQGSGGTGTHSAPGVSSPPSGADSGGAAWEERITLAAVGDVLLHSSVWKDAATGKGGFDFRPMFRQVKQYLESADITFANQESMMGGAALGLSDYPTFNSPFEIGEALKDAGVDVVSVANNHTLDRGEPAVVSAAKQWKKLGIEYAGAYVSDEDQARIRVIERNGIRVAFLAYSYGTNGRPVPKGKPYLINLLERDRLAQDIVEARKLADVVAVSMHFGTEYMRQPDDSQREWAKAAADAGADLVIGHHPHVLQPMEWITASSGKRTLVMYSLGNFLAGQSQDDPYRQIGGIARVDLVKTRSADGTYVRLENVRFLPTYIKYRNWRSYELMPFDRVTENVLPGAETYRRKLAAEWKGRMQDLQIQSSGSHK